MDRVPLLLDTDAGSDIDDAVALAYLLRQPRCELLGITTVTGAVEKRAAVCEAVCSAAGRSDVKIHLGRREPLLGGPGQPHVPHFDAIAERKPPRKLPENTAVDFLRSTIRSRPGEITLLTIGPFSNVALLFALDPEIPTLLKGLVSMGGAFFQGDRREWNALVDPTATQMVYRTPRTRHMTVGLDVTERCRLSRKDVDQRFLVEPLTTVRHMASDWFRHAEHMTFHDPLAAALVFEPQLARYEHGRVEATPTGTTRLVPGEGPDLVPIEIDVDSFFDHFQAQFV